MIIAYGTPLDTAIRIAVERQRFIESYYSTPLEDVMFYCWIGGTSPTFFLINGWPDTHAMPEGAD
jgi:hypothetical protein